MLVADAFASIATAVSAAFDGPFYDSVARWPGTAVYDDGGSIVSPGTPIEQPCQCQVDRVTEAMRSDAGFRDKDVRLLILASGLTKDIDTDATVEVTAGPNAGFWSVQTADRDPMGVYWECRGRRA